MIRERQADLDGGWEVCVMSVLSPPASWAPSYAWGTAGRSAAWSRATSGPLRRRKGARSRQ